MGLALTDDTPSHFDGLLAYIDEHLDRDICLPDLASRVGLSVTHFSHAFKTAYGMAPYQYITQRRIDRAKVLLGTTRHTVASIAAQLGFSSQSRFSQIMVRLAGTTPSMYRGALVRRRHAALDPSGNPEFAS